MRGSARRTELDQVPLADLGVVEVEHQSQVRAVDGLDQREAVGGRANGMPGWSTAVLRFSRHERDPLALAEPAIRVQGPLRPRATSPR